jgi:hypothetical protein
MNDNEKEYYMKALKILQILVNKRINLIQIKIW